MFALVHFNTEMSKARKLVAPSTDQENLDARLDEVGYDKLS